MNSIRTIDTEYLRPNRTIDTILVNQSEVSKVLWIYNFEGVHFRVFENLLDVQGFLNDSCEAQYEFDNENELDDFLTNFRLN